jgi:DNA-directed RNA polymerase specialized sigma24 family protein
MNSPSIDPVYLASAMNAAETRTARIASRLGLSTADRDDVFQEILLDLVQRAPLYDPSRASVNTFTGILSEHKAIEVMDALVKGRMRQPAARLRDAANDPVFSESADGGVQFADNVVPMWAEDSDLFAATETLRDLETALSYMSSEQRSMFDLLEIHMDLPSAAKASGMSSARFYRCVADLQMHLRMFGIRTAA